MEDRAVTVEHSERDHQAVCTWCTDEDGKHWAGPTRSGRSGPFRALMDASEHVGMIHALDHLAEVESRAERAPLAVIEMQLTAFQVSRNKWHRAAIAWRRTAIGMTIAWACILPAAVLHYVQ